MKWATGNMERQEDVRREDIHHADPVVHLPQLLITRPKLLLHPSADHSIVQLKQSCDGRKKHVPAS